MKLKKADKQTITGVNYEIEMIINDMPLKKLNPLMFTSNYVPFNSNTIMIYRIC